MGDYTFKLSDYGSHTLVFNNFGDEVSPHSLVAEIDSLQSRLAHLENLIDERDNKILSLDNECHGLQSQLSEARAQIERLRQTAYEFYDGYCTNINEVTAVALDKALKETPAQSLDEIISQSFMAGQADCGVDPSYSSAMDYAARLRQQTSESLDERSCMYAEYDEVE